MTASTVKNGRLQKGNGSVFILQEQQLKASLEQYFNQELVTSKQIDQSTTLPDHGFMYLSQAKHNRVTITLFSTKSNHLRNILLLEKKPHSSSHLHLQKGDNSTKQNQLPKAFLQDTLIIVLSKVIFSSFHCYKDLQLLSQSPCASKVTHSVYTFSIRIGPDQVPKAFPQV